MVTVISAPQKAVSLTIPGEPRSKQRARVTARGTYTPDATRQAQNKVRAAWQKTHAQPFTHQVVASIDFYNGNKRRRDVDNMAKLVLDALNKLAYADDYQVVELNIRKFHTSPQRARTEITLTEVIEWPCEAKTV